MANFIKALTLLLMLEVSENAELPPGKYYFHHHTYLLSEVVPFRWKKRSLLISTQRESWAALYNYSVNFCRLGRSDRSQHIENGQG
jgi:hypothetical protein